MFLRCPRCDYPVETGNVGDVTICRACSSPSVLRETLIGSRPMGSGADECLELTFNLYLHLITEAELRVIEAAAPVKALEIRRRRAALLS
jgi:hypothetical protein